MSETDLGFPVSTDSAWLSNRYFPSKVGGKPAWLELEHLPAREQLQCKKCGAPKAFLCQIYAPYEDDHNFHRTIYIFICRTSTCQLGNSSDNLTVLRSQLSRTNNFYSSEPPSEKGIPEPHIPASKKLCIACGCVGPLSCSRCKKANYCSAQHQRAHWSYHKQVCSVEVNDNETTSMSLPEIEFPEWEIVIEANEDETNKDTTPKEESDDDSDAREMERLLEYEKLVAEGKTGELKDVPDTEMEKYAQSSVAEDDKYFRKFKKEVNKDPEQIIRYKRNGIPLWIADIANTIAEQLKIPECEVCGGSRQFEFQIMPQMLLLLKCEHLDWGVLAVYTCANSCRPSSDVGYLNEYIVKQDIRNDNADS